MDYSIAMDVMLAAREPAPAEARAVAPVKAGSICVTLTRK
jgi:hypothetical protein